MPYDPTDAIYARRMLEYALVPTTNPTLSPAKIDDLMTLAESLDANGNTVYTGAKLNQVARIGWKWKAGLVSNQYDIGGSDGKLDRSQWMAHCRIMAAEVDVLGTKSSGRGIGSIAVSTSLTKVTT